MLWVGVIEGAAAVSALAAAVGVAMAPVAGDPEVRELPTDRRVETLDDGVARIKSAKIGCGEPLLP